MPSRLAPLVPSDTVFITRCPVPTATAIALNQGWFAEAFSDHGFKTETLQDSNDPKLRSQHFYHDLKALFREGGNVPAFWSRARNLATNGEDHTLVIGLTWVDETQLLLARPGSGIRDLSDLKGKTLGLSNAAGAVDIWRAMGLRGYETSLNLAGLTFDDVTLKNLTAPEVNWQTPRRGGTWSQASEQALLNGDVDVIYAKGAPAVALKEKHGLDVVLDINTLTDPALRINNGTPRPITIHKHLLSDHPELVKLYLQILNRASAWAKNHSDSVADIIAFETGTTTDAVHKGYGAGLSHTLDVNLSKARIDAFQDQADFLHSHGLIDAPVNVRNWIAAEPLQAALNDPLPLTANKAA
ncbi:ABC transporter substrate-binding protein [Asticcacaulis sp. ZE23SCel15]|uniref:ABC transporter substrate-binding protein n=1 Tax=Asticcacaulis sp. ZE23SCel15 TaxID=3059027 RepID=UPI00265F0211|nr:ABC transporter substrate-binding protein [Asticcacaulis sp. ZE23SCel15]WKL56745.1 ABC transporter substrate-binding protein [Asticcacaulis sp. ZE23SCel15]